IAMYTTAVTPTGPNSSTSPRTFGASSGHASTNAHNPRQATSSTASVRARNATASSTPMPSRHSLERSEIHRLGAAGMPRRTTQRSTASTTSTTADSNPLTNTFTTNGFATNSTNR